jgi:hypothetical protein
MKQAKRSGGAVETERTVCEPRLCGFCGREMNGRRRQASFCSDICRTRAARRQRSQRLRDRFGAVAAALDELRRELGLPISEPGEKT